MTKLWLYLGLVHLLVAVGIFVDQRVRFSIWWESEEFFHHETFIGLFFYTTLILLIVALVEHFRNVHRKKL